MQQQIQQFIVDELCGGEAPDELDATTMLIEEEVIDSLGIFELVSFIEATWGVEVEPEEITIDNFKTIGDIEKLIQTQQSGV